MDNNRMSALSSRRFHLGLQKSDAWDKGRRLADYLERTLLDVGYVGPVAVAGGYMRDLAMSRTPKDLDVFLDGGCVRSLEHAREIGNAVSAVLGHGAEVSKILQCYGIWAKDLDHVVKIGFPPDPGQELLYIGGIPIPFGVDVVILRRGEMAKAGYAPSVHLDPATRSTFLLSVLRRVDIRLNAIGSASTMSLSADAWDDDALHSRLVIQYERLQDGTGDERIDRRVLRLQSEKYAGWTVHLEGPGGDLTPC